MSRERMDLVLWGVPATCAILLLATVFAGFQGVSLFPGSGWVLAHAKAVIFVAMLPLWIMLQLLDGKPPSPPARAPEPSRPALPVSPPPPPSLTAGLRDVQRAIGGVLRWATDRYEVGGTRRGAAVAVAFDRSGSIELRLRPAARPRPMDVVPTLASIDPRVVALVHNEARRLQTRGRRIVITTDLTIHTVGGEAVLALIDAALELAGALPDLGAVAVDLAPVASGQICPWCRDGLAPDAPDTTACTRCGTSHHAECFTESGGCTVLGCAGAARQRVRP